jgi:hypothetical protein
MEIESNLPQGHKTSEPEKIQTHDPMCASCQKKLARYATLEESITRIILTLVLFLVVIAPVLVFFVGSLMRLIYILLR